MTTMGRPRDFRNNAEKQKAYRERLKSALEANEAVAAFVDRLGEMEEALRKSMDYHTGKGKNPEIELSKFGTHMVSAQIMVDGHSNSTTNSLLCEWLIASGELVLVRKDWHASYFQFKKGVE